MFSVILVNPAWLVSRYQRWIFLPTTLHTAINYSSCSSSLLLKYLFEKLAYDTEKLFYMLCILFRYVYAITMVPLLAGIATSEIIQNTEIISSCAKFRQK